MEPKSDAAGLNREQWIEKLDAIGKKTKAKLCLIGSAACIFSGMRGRTSIDLDVWNPKSRFDYQEFRAAVEEAGLLLNPTDEIVEQPYIQIIEPGICQTGKFDETVKIMDTGGVEISRPPVENLIASKLLRCEQRDLEDIAHLSTTHNPERAGVEKAIRSMPAGAKNKALENMVYLDVINQGPDV